MKRIFVGLIGLLLTAVSYAQPKNVQNAGKAVFTLTTFKSDGTILESSHGAFISADGIAIAPWSPFNGAAKATVIDATGKQYEVECLMGINELYNVAKFKVNAKVTPVSIAQTASKEGTKAWLIPYSIKNAECKPATVKGVEPFMEKYTYYTFDMEAGINEVGCPLVNGEGQLLGLMEISSTTYALHATDANFVQALSVNAMSINDPALSKTAIRTALPDKESDAQLALLLAHEKYDIDTYEKYAEAFIKKFPQSPEGYNTLASIKVERNDFAGAANDMETAIRVSEKKDAAHSSYAQLIYQKIIYMSDKPYEPWTLDKALDEVEQAYAINPLQTYLHQKAQILYAKQDYSQSLNLFTQLSQGELRGGEVFYECAQCKSMMGAEKEEILALLDSAVNACPQPLTQMSAPYVLARGNMLDEMGAYRDAMADYNRYDTLMMGRAHHTFYYTRFKCETKTRRYQQALEDIAHAIILNPKEPVYLAEMASLQLRLKRLPEAINVARRCTEVAPDYPDGFLLLGIAQGENGDKADAIQNLRKAAELGDTRADTYIDKYK